jgi:hypothetical protein
MLLEKKKANPVEFAFLNSIVPALNLGSQRNHIPVFNLS